MSTVLKIPGDNKQFLGQFKGEFAGNIFHSRSIDLERQKGKVTVAESYSHIVHSAQVGFSNLITPVAFVRSSADGTDRYFANAGRIFKTSGTNPETGWAEDAIVSSPTAPLYDLIDFSGALIVPTATDLSRLASGAWTASWWTAASPTGLAQAAMGSNPHRFAILAGKLLITDGRFIHTYDGTIAVTNALTLPTGFEGYRIKPWTSIGFIFGRSIGGGEVDVFEWDGITGNYINKYPSGDSEVLCMFVAGNVPYLITKKGSIRRFTGQGFESVQQFPTVERGLTINNIHPNGVIVDENIVKIFVDFGASTDSGILDTRILSGIWTFDITNNNLYHSGSVKNTSGADQAQLELPEVGAMLLTATLQGRYLIGARVYTNYSSASRYGIFSSDETDTSNEGYFMTPKLTAQTVKNFWKRLQLKFKQLDSGDVIRIAYRVIDSTVFPQYETITWLSTTTFSATNANIQVGDFVEVISGDNAGMLARVTAYSGGTVTIDRGLSSSTNSSRVRYHRFIDLGLVSSQGINSEIMRITDRGETIQLLVEIRGTENSPHVEELLIHSEPRRV